MWLSSLVATFSEVVLVCTVFGAISKRYNYRTEKMTKSSGYPGDEERINDLKDRLRRLVEDFDRAIGVEALNTVRRNGRLHHLKTN
jgi:hypothetical protein